MIKGNNFKKSLSNEDLVTKFVNYITTESDVYRLDSISKITIINYNKLQLKEEYFYVFFYAPLFLKSFY